MKASPDHLEAGRQTAPARTLSDITEIVATRECNGETYDVCATGLARFEDETSKLTVELDSFVRRVNLRGRDEYFRPAWLPRRDVVSDRTSIDEAFEEEKEILQRWAAKVRQAIPGGAGFQQTLAGCEMGEAVPG